MRLLLQRIPLTHWWQRMKWGGNSHLDCRECRICGRFEVWAYSGFYRADRARFEPVVKVQ